MSSSRNAAAQRSPQDVHGLLVRPVAAVRAERALQVLDAQAAVALLLRHQRAGLNQSNRLTELAVPAAIGERAALEPGEFKIIAEDEGAERSDLAGIGAGDGLADGAELGAVEVRVDGGVRLEDDKGLLVLLDGGVEVVHADE